MFSLTGCFKSLECQRLLWPSKQALTLLLSFAAPSFPRTRHIAALPMVFVKEILRELAEHGRSFQLDILAIVCAIASVKSNGSIPANECRQDAGDPRKLGEQTT